MLYVGLDVHSRQSSLCILNSAGGTVNQIQLKGPRATVVDRLRQLDQPFSICYEASCGYGHLYEALRPLAAHVAVAHPGKLRLIYGDKRKNDRVDAQKLAKLLLLDMVPRVHVPDVDVRAWRSLITFRQRVLQQLVRAKNQVRGVLREHDLAGPKWLWSKKQLAWLESLPLHPVARLKLDLAGREAQRMNERLRQQGESRVSGSSGLDKWPNLVPAALTVSPFGDDEGCCHVASLSEVGPALRDVAPRVSPPAAVDVE